MDLTSNPFDVKCLGCKFHSIDPYILLQPSTTGFHAIANRRNENKTTDTINNGQPEFMTTFDKLKLKLNMHLYSKFFSHSSLN